MRLSKALFVGLLALGLVLSGCSSEDDGGNKDKSVNKEDVLGESKDEKKKQFYLPDGLRDIDPYETVKVLDGADDLEFVPSDDYGDVLCYVGDMKTFRTPNQEDAFDPFLTSTTYTKYGLCTSDGTIIKNPIYQYIWQSPAGHIVLSHPHPEEMAGSWDSDEPVSWEESGVTNAVTIIPSDGSWQLYLPADTWENAWNTGTFEEDGSFSVYKQNPDGGADYYFYDENCNLVSQVSGYDYITEFNMGLANAYKYGNGGDSKNVFIDIDGNVVLGPYKNASHFTEQGVAYVETQDGFGLINTKGEFVVQPEYESIRTEFTSEGFRFSGVKDSKRTFFNSDGSVLHSFDDERSVTLFGSKDKMVYRSYGVNYESKYRRVADDSELVCQHCQNSPNDYINDGEYYVYRDPQTEVCCLFDYSGRKLAELDGYIYADNMVSDSRMIMYVAKAKNPPSQTNEYGGYYRDYVIFDVNKGEEVIRFECASQASFVQDKKYIVVSFRTDEGADHDGQYLYDVENKKVLFENALGVFPYTFKDKIYYNVYTENYSRLYDENLKLVLSITNSDNV